MKYYDYEDLSRLLKITTDSHEGNSQKIAQKNRKMHKIYGKIALILRKYAQKLAARCTGCRCSVQILSGLCLQKKSIIKQKQEAQLPQRQRAMRMLELTA